MATTAEKVTSTPDKVSTHWECDDDAWTIEVTLAEIVQVGTPICPRCDEEMTLADTVTVEVAQS